jgi:hypothetical protein
MRVQSVQKIKCTGERMKLSVRVRLGVALCAATLLAGGALAQGKPESPTPNSGFLDDYSQLAAVPDTPNTRRWVRKDFDFKPFQQIVIDPIEVWVNPASTYKGASPDMLKQMTDNFANSFKSALQSGYKVVDKPGPGVLRIRLAITGLTLEKPAFKPYQVLPILLIARAASSEKNVVLTAEMQVLDPDNKVVGAAVSVGTGDKTIDEKQNVTWKDIQSITDAWAKRLRAGLDEARGIAVKK